MAVDDVFVGQILVFGFNFPPKGYAFCNGALLSISQNTALFSLLGTMYGGDGKVTFALPDLRGAAPLGAMGLNGPGPGLSTYDQGQTGGSESIVLTAPEMPRHTHALRATSVACRNGAGDQRTPEGNVLATESSGVTATYSSALPNAPMRTGSIAVGGTATAAAVGSGQPHENLQPYLTLNYCIALQGVFPPRP